MSSVNTNIKNAPKKISKRNFLKVVVSSAFGVALLQITGVFSSLGLVKKPTSEKTPRGYSAGGYGN
jgi:hypothetical protein